MPKYTHFQMIELPISNYVNCTEMPANQLINSNLLPPTDTRLQLLDYNLDSRRNLIEMDS